MGYTAPNARAAAPVMPKQLAPSEYNKNELPIPASARRHTAVGLTGDKWPSGQPQDHWFNYDPAPNLPQIAIKPTLQGLPSSNQAVDPVDTPWSRGAAIARVAALASGGVVEPKKDILDIARSFVSTVTDPATKDWWSKRVNILDRLQVISTTRGLTADETAAKGRILAEIDKAAQDPASLTPAAYAPPPPAPVPPWRRRRCRSR